jgi:hypothetical protein
LHERQSTDVVVQALRIGDIGSVDHVAFGAPALLSGSDQDMETAAATRQALLRRASADRLMITGYHLNGGGMGRVEVSGDAYRFVPQV